jgi:hypothetical protein
MVDASTTRSTASRKNGGGGVRTLISDEYDRLVPVAFDR